MAIRSPGPTRRLTAVALSTIAGFGCAPEPELTFSDARIREPAPGRDVTVAYVDVTNTLPDTTLTSARSGAARSIEFHTTLNDGGMMRMRRLPGIELPSGQTVRLAPGGAHLMVFGVTALDKSVDIVFTTANGMQKTVAFRTIALTETGDP